MSKKIWIAGGSILAVIVIAVVAVLLLTNKEDAYRVIKVLELDGTAVVDRGTVGALDAYEGMVLQSGDKISVDANSFLVLQMDDDKYAYVEQNTILNMVAEGTSRDSKTTIQLETGAVTCQVENKLNENSSYEIHTQNSVMAIRGTVVRVEILEQYEWLSMYPELIEMFRGNEHYDKITQVSVQEGRVSVSLQMPDGTVNNEVMLDAGYERWIGGNDSDSSYIGDTIKIRTEMLDVQAIRALNAALEGNPDICFTKEELDVLLDNLTKSGTYRVYFFSGDTLFGVQEVTAGAKIQEPDLMPTEHGSWSVDFNKAVDHTVYVYWNAEEE